MVDIFHFNVFCVNEEPQVDVKVPHVMRCMFYYSRLISHTIFEQKTKLRKGCISYFKSNGNHGPIVKKIKEEMNSNLNSPIERTTCKENAYDECKCNLQFFGGHGSLQKK
jgi:hypothetical protein